MKVLFDSQVFDWQISGGISRYFTEVISRLDTDPGIEVLFNCRHSYNRYIQGSKWLTRKPVATKVHFKGKLRLVKLFNQQLNRPYSNKLLKKSVPDIFHPTYYDPYFLKLLGKKPLVVTVHDLTTEKLQAGDPAVKTVLDWKAQLIHRADQIITVSENTKRDLTGWYNINPDRITTAHLASDLVSSTAAGKAPDLPLPGQFILYVGSRKGYKNFNSFVLESAPVLKKYELSLVIAGGGALDIQEKVLLKKAGIAERAVSFTALSDQQLVTLYKKAVLFVFPSLYEGFGIPVIEAMECNCPVLLSNNSSLPEVGGDAAAYFDPSAEGALAQALSTLLDNQAGLDRMKEAGIKQASRFSWEKTTALHKEVYKKLFY